MDGNLLSLTDFLNNEITGLLHHNTLAMALQFAEYAYGTTEEWQYDSMAVWQNGRMVKQQDSRMELPFLSTIIL